MIRDFKEELAPAENDTELTLGAGAFLAIGGGLLLLCAVCFGLGYAVGHRNSPDQSAATVLPVPESKIPVMPVGSGSKPGAAAQMPAQSQAQPVGDTSVDASGQGIQSEPTSSSAGSSQGDAKPTGDSGVRPALGALPQPARSQAQGWMVQIAAVTHSEDAQVLVDALRRRGYSVQARRDVGDNLIHVQTGPFVSRNDANAMRQKLLNDGYNAIVQ